MRRIADQGNELLPEPVQHDPVRRAEEDARGDRGEERGRRDPPQRPTRPTPTMRRSARGDAAPQQRSSSPQRCRRRQHDVEAGSRPGAALEVSSVRRWCAGSLLDEVHDQGVLHTEDAVAC